MRFCLPPPNSKTPEIWKICQIPPRFRLFTLFFLFHPLIPSFTHYCPLSPSPPSIIKYPKCWKNTFLPVSLYFSHSSALYPVLRLFTFFSLQIHSAGGCPEGPGENSEINFLSIAPRWIRGTVARLICDGLISTRRNNLKTFNQRNFEENKQGFATNMYLSVCQILVPINQN